MFQFGLTVTVVGMACLSSNIAVAAPGDLWSEGSARVFTLMLPHHATKSCFLFNQADQTRIIIVRDGRGRTALSVLRIGALQKITVKLPDGDKTWDIGGTESSVSIVKFADDLLKAMASLRTVTVVVEGADKTVSAKYPGTTAVAQLNACVKQLR